MIHATDPLLPLWAALAGYTVWPWLAAAERHPAAKLAGASLPPPTATRAARLPARRTGSDFRARMSGSADGHAVPGPARQTPSGSG
ncbi:MAG TPA: hypothetical protein VFJ16_31220 [Longimicrobium sp.]|nr:hypothetical protein [Longimicrobium sp.]